MTAKQINNVNPLRSPNWRGKHAYDVVQHGRFASRRCEDRATLRLIKFLRMQRHCLTDADRECVEARYADESAALAVYHHVGELRTITESYILAREPLPSIAEQTGINGSAIECFEQCFFDVSDRLDNSAFIIDHIMSSHASEDVEDDGRADWRFACRFLAYTSGAEWLNKILLTDGISCLTQWRHPAKSVAAISEGTLAVIACKVARAVPQMDLRESRVAQQLLEQCAKVMGEAKAGDVPENAMERHLLNMFQEMPTSADSVDLKV